MADDSTDSTTLTVDLNHESLHSIAVPPTFASADSFVIELDNHGEGTHVHLRLDEALSEVASIPSSNHYVRPGATTRVPVSITDPGPVGGVLTVATAYGSQTETVELTIEPTAGKRRVEVDDSLVEHTSATSVGTSDTSARSSSAPNTTETTTNTTASRRSASPRTSGSLDGLDTPVLLGVAAIVVLAGIVLLFVPGVTVYIGVLAVIVGVVAAGYLVLY